jgi:hypothetical protein
VAAPGSRSSPWSIGWPAQTGGVTRPAGTRLHGSRCRPYLAGVDTINPNRMPDDEDLTDLSSLAVFFGGSGDSWTGDFLRLVAKSDPEHRARLREAFPLLVNGWEAWMLLAHPTVGALTTELQLLGLAG